MRYFFISYQYTIFNKQKRMAEGITDATWVTGKKFINRKEVEARLIEMHTDKKAKSNVIFINFVSILELSKQDYLDFVGK